MIRDDAVKDIIRCLKICLGDHLGDPICNKCDYEHVGCLTRLMEEVIRLLEPENERVEAEWLPKHLSADEPWTCSNCNNNSYTTMIYCPSCLAKMYILNKSWGYPDDKYFISDMPDELIYQTDDFISDDPDRKKRVYQIAYDNGHAVVVNDMYDDMCDDVDY